MHELQVQNKSSALWPNNVLSFGDKVVHVSFVLPQAWLIVLKQVEPDLFRVNKSTKWSVWAYLLFSHWHLIPKVTAVSSGRKNLLCWSQLNYHVEESQQGQVIWILSHFTFTVLWKSLYPFKLFQFFTFLCITYTSHYQTSMKIRQRWWWWWQILQSRVGQDSFTVM